MRGIITGLYIFIFCGVCAMIGTMVWITPVMWPAVFLAIPMGAWAAIDINFLWKE